jgi:hypothetical protein
MFSGVIPRKARIRRIAGIRISNLCPRNMKTSNKNNLNLNLNQANLMPESKEHPAERKN